MAISMTPAAEKHVRAHLDNRGKGLGIRLGVKTTGCSGLSYVLEFVDDVNPEDKVIPCGSVNLYIDAKSYLYLDGTELDFVKEGLNEGFQFNNPNVKEECGCGESFHV
jgi:iron-sulfur cluster assembly protein